MSSCRVSDIGDPSPSTNTSWGDIIGTKNERSLRLYFQDINGLSTKELQEAWIDILHTMENLDVDMFGLAETNINWTPNITNYLYQQLRKNVSYGSRQLKLVSASCEDPTSTLYQPGGVCHVSLGEVSGRIGHLGKDPHGLGRWTYMTVQGQHTRKIVIATVYRVAQAYAPQGYRTTYNQQFRALRRQGKENPEPQQQLAIDLLEAVKKWKEDSEVIVLIDANTTNDNNRWAQFLANAELFDLLENRHGMDSPRTCIRGSTTIDYIYGTSAIVDGICAAGMLPFHHKIVSDHRGLWIDLDIPHLLKGSIAPVLENLHLQPRTKNKSMCSTIRKAITQTVRQYDIAGKIRQLKEDTNMEPAQRETLLNEYDGQLTEAMVSAMRKCKPQFPFWWSPELHHAYIVVKIWKLRRTELAYGVDFTDQITTLMLELPIDYDVHMGLDTDSVTTHLRRAKTRLKEIRASSVEARREYQHARQDPGGDATPQERKRARNLEAAETQNRIHSKIKRYYKPGQKQMLNHVITKTSRGEEQRLVLKDEMEQALLTHHAAHFSQAQGTPFTEGPIPQTFGADGDTQLCADFRDGTFNVESLNITDPYVLQYLKRLQPTENDPPTINTSVTAKDIKRGFKL